MQRILSVKRLENNSFAKNVKVPNSWKLIYIKCRFKQKYFLWFLPLPTPCMSHFRFNNLHFYLISHAILPWFAASPLHFSHSHIDFLHSAYPHSVSYIPTLIAHIPVIPTLIPTFPLQSSMLPSLPPFPPCPHSAHSVPWLPIQVFTDSYFMLLTQYHLLIS